MRLICIRCRLPIPGQQLRVPVDVVALGQHRVASSLSRLLMWTVSPNWTFGQARFEGPVIQYEWTSRLPNSTSAILDHAPYGFVQKSGRNAIGTPLLKPGQYSTMFSAQTCSVQGLVVCRYVIRADHGIVNSFGSSTV
jgi:hypothetical protein